MGQPTLRNRSKTCQGGNVVRVASVFLFLLSSIFSSIAFAQADARTSAYRAPGSDYRGYKTVATILGIQGGLQTQDRVTPMQAARMGTASLPKATEWENETVMGQRFDYLRDLRFMTVPAKPNFLRRSSWMYPDDGCFARAALAVRNLLRWSAVIAAPKKVFAFGNLTVKTANAPNGSVSWWYHVAPLVEISGQKYVLDPALEPNKPLKLEDWLALMSDQPQDLEVSVCESGSYTPGDDCTAVSDGVEAGAEQDQVYYLDQEWQRLLELQRQPEQELGDFPPWIH
jgi:hypothetical protein